MTHTNAHHAGFQMRRIIKKKKVGRHVLGVSSRDVRSVEKGRVEMMMQAVQTCARKREGKRKRKMASCWVEMGGIGEIGGMGRDMVSKTRKCCPVE